MSEVVGAFVCAEARHEEANSAAKAALRPLGSFAQIRLELAEGHLNPIEMSFSKLKAYLRKAAERTQRSLRRRIGLFVPRLGADECANYFAHARYVSI